MKERSLFSASTWIAWLGATLIAALTMSSYAFTTFETKADAQAKKSEVTVRLDRIESLLIESLKAERRGR